MSYFQTILIADISAEIDIADISAEICIADIYNSGQHGVQNPRTQSKQRLQNGKVNGVYKMEK
jgi:hypothetical protein